MSDNEQMLIGLEQASNLDTMTRGLQWFALVTLTALATALTTEAP